MPKDQYNKKIIYLPERLESQLSELLEYPCTVVTAPSNFGKTTAIRECVHRLQEEREDLRVLWQTLLADDDTFFWEDLSELFLPISETLSGLISKQAGRNLTQRRQFLKGLAACQVAEGQEVLVVIDADDFGCSDNIREFFEVLVKNCPACIQQIEYAPEADIHV